ncbi:MAG: Cyclic nucleotide-regulated FAD-dependent pyridine nucleotide-disulfide oxidoreductase [Caulobacteraceae bacterium]|nr:Cyclic nucleotide-regulated FAD-dependent pyridine nucleotide-disulfide oxidoreductase [Caulobacteraceae bacterium]
MDSDRPKTLLTRRDQMFFPLTAAEIDRLRRFGTIQAFADGDYLVRAGQQGLGLAVVLSGRVDVTRRDGLGHDERIVSYRTGDFIGEVGQLSGRAAFVDSRAHGPVQALMIPPEGLRGVVVAEAELGERIMRALILRRVGLIEAGAGGPMLIGPPDNPNLIRLQNFLARNAIPYRVLDPATEHDADALLACTAPGPHDLPLVLCPDGSVLRNPDEQVLAERIGLLPKLDSSKVYDVAVVGAGPAGLATAVYAASEGLSVVVLEARAFGGQAGASARIENYLGFPTGISGQALAGRAFAQAQKFGADIVIPAAVRRLDCSQPDGYVLELAAGDQVRARTVVIAAGAEYRRPDLPGLQEVESDGVHYWASPVEGRLCAEQEVALVGGGNSAGQAAVYLSSKAAKVWMLVRRPGLEATMSRYLIDRIAAQPNIELLANTEVLKLEADAAGALRRIIWRNHKTGQTGERSMRHLFLFIGADPCTSWMDGCDAAIDARGFLLTGAEARPGTTQAILPLQTSLDGVFAIGDVRSGSTKRVAAAVGEGAAVVAQIHGYLANRQEPVEREKEATA